MRRLGGLVLVVGLLWAPPALSQAPPIPSLAAWQSNMTTKGQLRIDYLAAEASHSWDQNLDSVYYDGERVLLQIYVYTGSSNADWLTAANTAEIIYRDRYVIPASYQAQGYRNFTTGLRMDWERNADTTSKATVVGLANNQYGWDTADTCVDQSLSREAAYAMLALQEAERVGEAHRARRDVLRESVYGHITQWLANPPTGQLSPFMMGLTAHSLIRDWEETGDARAVPQLVALAEWMWTNAWDATSQSMWYDLNAAPLAPAVDLNLLIAPLYAWLWKQTGNEVHLTRGDALFVGGVAGAWLDGGKQFNQNYWWSFDYVTWRTKPNAHGIPGTQLSHGTPPGKLPH